MTAYGETSTTNPGSKSAAEIEREVKQERAHVERTLDELQERLSPGQLIDQAVTYLRGSGGADLMRNLGETVKQNPMPLALVGVGLAWMMFADRRDRYARPSYWDEDDDLAYDADRDQADLYPEDDPYEVGVSASAYGTGAATAVEHDNGEGWADRAKATAEGAKDKAAELGERARGLAEDATAGAGRLGAAARERLSRARALAGRAGDGRALARRYGRRARRGFLHTLDEHPLVLGAIGLALGAALGSALPPSESEDRLLGETRDRLKRQAVKIGHEQVKKAEAAAGAAYDAAREETERQGLTPEAVTQAAKEATSAARQKVERVGEVAASAARSEMKGSGSEQERDTV
jgi:Protein of unknown function (DUF3618)